MKYLCLFAAFLGALAAQPRIGRVELYGARLTSPARIRQALAVQPGDPLPKSHDELEARLLRIETVAEARVEGFCCEAGKLILYVGIRERATPAPAFSAWPTAELAVPDEVARTYAGFVAARVRASDPDSEDYANGQLFMTDVNARIVQQRFPVLAELHADRLRAVLRNSEDAAQRAIAAYVLGFTPDGDVMLDPMRAALSDPAVEVRSAAAHSLQGFALDGLGIESTALIDMLNSPELADRLSAVRALEARTRRPDTELNARLRAHAFPALLEMARWQRPSHARPAFLVAGRVAGRSEAELEAAWTSNQREKLLAAIAASK
jgi:hypothetical protein